MRSAPFRNRQSISRIIGIFLGVLFCIALPHPWIGVVAGVTLSALIGRSTAWKEGALRGALTGLAVILLAGFVIIPPRISKSGFAFWDSFFFDLLLGGLGSVVIGGSIGAGMSWMRTENINERH